MERYAGLDVSLKLTAICMVDGTGKIEREGVVSSDPDAIATFIKSHASNVARIGLETGATTTWLWTELNKRGLRVKINENDRNDRPQLPQPQYRNGAKRYAPVRIDQGRD
jgi:hypothetical protein